jgi:hypothetical protein
MKPDRTRSSSFQFRIGAKKKMLKKSETPIGIYTLPFLLIKRSRRRIKRSRQLNVCGGGVAHGVRLVGAVGPVMTPVGHRNVVPLIFSFLLFLSELKQKKKKV